MKNILVYILFALLLISGCTANTEVTSSGSLTESDDAIPDAGSSSELPSDKFATGNDANDITINGWNIEYPKSLKQLNMTMIDGVMKIEFEKFTFSVRDNRIFIDDRDYGNASTGDTVLVGLEGDVAVNGELRDAVSK